MIQAIGWILSIFSIAGAVVNTRMNKWSFVIWTFTNTGWIFYNILTQTYEQIPIWIAYNITSVYGFYNWSNIEKIKKGETD